MNKLKLLFTCCAITVFSFPVRAGNDGIRDTVPVKIILFVGNSLTYTNNLPALVTAIGKENGIEISAGMLAYPNYALEDHWNDGKLQELMKKKFDFVVLQQGPSSQNDGRDMLMEYGKKISKLARKQDTKPAFFMVWPSLSNMNNFDGVIKNYTDAAEATHSILCPVGRVWKEYFTNSRDYSYLGPDGFHPSLKGSESAARIIYDSLFK